MNNICPTTNQHCSEVKILTNSYKMLNEKIDSTLNEVREVNKQNSEHFRRVYDKIDENHKDTMERIEKMNNSNKGNYVSKDEFSPVKKFVYGLASVVLLGFLGAVLKLIFQ